MTPDAENPVPDYHVSIALPVVWADQDAMGHVNNTVYFRWFESARIEYFDRLAIHHTLEGQQLAPILASTKCDFILQVKHPDTVHVAGRVTRLGRTSITMQHAVFSEHQNNIVAKGESVMVVFDYQKNQTHPIPEDVRDKIIALEGDRLEK